MRKLVALFTFLLCSSIFAYELSVIQGVSREKQTFVTRNTEVGNKKIFQGKRATFTSDNVSIIAKAITVTNEFVQWEILNDYTDVPFVQGEIVTMYDAREHLWALTPELQKKKSVSYEARRSLEAQLFITRGLSESTSESNTQNTERGGLQFEAALRTEITSKWSLAYGLRYAREVVNLEDASLINTRFLGTFEARYYFPPIIGFYDARVGLGLGAGYGQSRSELLDDITSGNAVLLPTTKISLTLPFDKWTEIELVASFESLRLDETDAADKDITTNLNLARGGIIYRKHL
jgi:hypothetical protein